ncbi:MAG: CHASE2 domain-containing protein [Acidobacteriaceae bacterium]
MNQARRWSKHPWWGTGVALALICFVLALLSGLIGSVLEVGNRTNDSFFRLRDRNAGRSSIVVVAIDDAALSQQGRWPWHRSQLAHLIDIIAAGHPRAIGLDVLLSEPSDAGDDDALAASLTRAGNVILPAKITTSPAGPLWIEPLPLFVRAALGIGHVQAILDEDGVCRRLPRAEMSLHGRLPMMAELLADTPRAGMEKAAESPGVDVLLPSEVIIDYRGLASASSRPRGPFPTISAARIFSGETYDLRQHTVLIGFAGTGLEDELLTPLSYSAPAPGVLIQANMVDTLERSRVIKGANPLVQYALLLMICIIGAKAMQQENSLRIVAWIIGSATATYAVAYLCLVLWGIQFELGQAMVAELLVVPLGQLQHILLLQGIIGNSLGDLQKQAEGLPLHLAGVLAPQLDIKLPMTSLTSPESKLNLITRMDQQIAIVSAFQQSLLSGMRDGIAVFDESGSLLFENAAWQEFLVSSGWRLEESWTELLKVLDPSMARSAGVVSITNDAEYVSRMKIDNQVLIAGRLWRISMAMLPSVTSVNKTLCMVLTADLTPQMERDQARQQALQFITHELRTPLVSLLGFAELLQQFPEQARKAGAADVIQQESQRLIALTTMFLECLKLETALPVVKPTDTDVEAVIEKTTSLARPLCTASNKRLIVRKPSGKAHVSLDSAMMTGALLNLVANAVKYGSDRTDIEIRVEAENGTVKFGVHNQGPRIPEQEIPLLFTPQYRMLENSMGRTGWGIGLAFVKRVMDAHGGEVRVKSNDVETCFQLLLPVQPPLDEAKS